MQARAEPLSGNPRNLWSSLRNMPTVASQRAAGEKFVPPNRQILSKYDFFAVPLRLLGSGTGTGIEIFEYDTTSRKLRTSHGLWGKILSVFFVEISRNFPEKC